MLSMLRTLLEDEQGATAIEYGLISALISIAAITAFTTVGTRLTSKMMTVANKLQ
jgi:pilus assembly protein Flp/PilA